MSLLYGFKFNVPPASRTAYYYANFSAGSIAQGGAVTFYPTQTTATYVSIQLSFGAQAPAGAMIAGLVVSPSNGRVAGAIGVSPAVDVPVTASLTGASGTIASVTIPAGQTEASFDWSVVGQGGLSDVEEFTKQAAEPPK